MGRRSPCRRNWRTVRSRPGRDGSRRHCTSSAQSSSGTRSAHRDAASRVPRVEERVSALWSAYRLAAPLAGAIAPAMGALAPAGERALWDERLGRIAARESPDAWIHSASMGEAVAAAALLRELRARRPHARFLLTATTRTGRD